MSRTMKMRKLEVALYAVLIATCALYLAGRSAWDAENDRQRFPDFELETISKPGQSVTAAAFSRRPALVNLWASWCLACRTEHPLLMKLAESGRIALYGVNYRDDRDDAIRWLEYFGNPYVLSVYDSIGRLGDQLGVDAIPGTFLLGSNGRVLYRHQGPLNQKVMREDIWPRVKAMEIDAE